MKIWFVQSARRDVMGGGEAFAVRLGSWLRSRNHRVRVVARPESLMAEAAAASWLEVRTLSMRNDFDWSSRLQLARWFAADRPDVVFGAYGRDIKLAGRAARKAGARLYWLQGILLADGSRMHKRLDRRFVHGYFVPSHYLKEKLATAGEIDRAKIKVVRPALDPTRFEPGRDVADSGEWFRKAYAADLSTPVTICSARLIEGKGQDVLLRAWVKVREAMPEALLLLLGDGPNRKALEALRVELGLTLSVRFTGHLRDVRQALWVADLMVLPTRSDSFPVVILEAMAAGVPVVASRVGGIPEQIVAGKSGLLVPPDDVDALAAAILRVLKEKPLRDALAAGGRERMLRFTADVCFPPLEAAISDHAGEQPAPHGTTSGATS